MSRHMRGAMAALLWLGISLAAHAQTTVEYIHTDALGTPIAVTDANKVVIETTEYEPYGAQVAGPVKDGPGFTGHVQDVATGLTYMQQRYYDPLSGRFLSVDPINAIDDPVGYFNRYVYAKNNPYRFTDPDGRGWFDEFLPPPSSVTGRTNPYASIPGADRGDRYVVGGLVATAVAGGACAAGGCAVLAAGARQLMVTAEGASLQTGLATQQALNAGSNTATVVATAAAGTVEADIVRGAYVTAAANGEKIVDAVSSYVVPGPPAMTPAGVAAGLGSVVVGEIEQVEVIPPPQPDPTIHR